MHIKKTIDVSIELLQTLIHVEVRIFITTTTTTLYPVVLTNNCALN